MRSGPRKAPSPASPIVAVAAGRLRGATETQIILATAGAGLLVLDPRAAPTLHRLLPASLEALNEIQAAAKVIDSVYEASPHVLGVVRSTTDFYTRTNQPPRAIATLLAAAKSTTPNLARSFTLEAAQRANDSNNTAQARTLALQLLTLTPYDAQVLALIALSYARANDDAGLKAFFTAQLAAVKTAALTPAERKSYASILRRCLIPALTRTHVYEGAVTQYSALLAAGS